MRRQTTKELIAASFLELAQKKPIDKITITNITDNCGLSQPTFYNHFQDKYDLISWMYTMDVAKIMSKVGEEDFQWRDMLIEGVRHFEAHRKLLLNALNHTGGQDSFVKTMTTINEDLLTTQVRKKIMTENIPIVLQCYIKLYCHGTVQFLFDWLTGTVKLSPEEVVMIWENSLPAPLKQYLED